MNKTPKPAKVITRIALLLLATSLVSGCSVRIKNYVELVEKFVEGPEDVQLSAEEIKAYPYAGQYITVSEQPRALMALAFDDNNLLKWRTGGDEIISTQHGRFIGSVNMNGAIAHTSNLESDPLHCFKRTVPQGLEYTSQCPMQWQRTVWISSATPEHMTDILLTYSSEFRVLGTEQLTLPNQTTVTVIKIEESSEAYSEESETPSISSATFTNTFWLEQQSGRTVKSQQFIAPTIGYVEIEEVKPYAGDLKPVHSESSTTKVVSP